MSWTTPGDLKGQLARLWERGELLRRLLTNEAGAPIRLALKGPGSSDLTDRFEGVRAWAADLSRIPHVRVEWREVRHRVQGIQRLPAQVWVETLDDALAWLGKRRDAARFVQLADATRAAQPALSPWLAKRPLQALELADRWQHLLAAVNWVALHPRPAIYLRQVDIAGVHSKFIETHRAVLSELLDLTLAADAIQLDRSGVTQFSRRYGFLDKPVRIRMRVLDESLRLLPGRAARPDITLDAESFAQLDLAVGRVFITENETNFLAFPTARDAIVIFGAGYGWDALAGASWLARCSVYYWGDIDTHGYAILDRLRAYFSHVSSFLMDRKTLHNHEALWGEEPDQVVHDLPRLTEEERAMFDDLRDNRIRKNLRLEQERIGYKWVTRALRDVELAGSLVCDGS